MMLWEIDSRGVNLLGVHEPEVALGWQAVEGGSSFDASHSYAKELELVVVHKWCLE